MVSNYQRDAYKALWMVALLLCLAEILFGQTRLGLHFTQKELNIWRQRAENGPYKTKGDVCTKSPGDWERIVGNANSFLSNPSGERWKGQDVGIKLEERILADKMQVRRDAKGCFAE